MNCMQLFHKIAYCKKETFPFYACYKINLKLLYKKTKLNDSIYSKFKIHQFK